MKCTKVVQRLTILLLLIILSSCSDLIDKNISKSTLIIQSPPDNFTTNNFNVPFIWNALDGADNYHFQIVKPNFDSIQQLILDTITTATQYTAALLSGIYQWRISAENGSSTTAFITRRLNVDTNSNLSGQLFIVTAPSANFITNNAIINFSWQAFPSANLYEFTLTDQNNNTLQDKIIPSTVLIDTLTSGGFYWAVRALNTSNNTTTQYSTARLLTINTTTPAVSTPLSPPNNSIDTNGIILTWQRPSGIVGDSIIVSNDSTFQNNNLNYYTTGSSSYLLPPLSLNVKYYWRLRSQDAAGNLSAYSAVYSFTVNH